MCWPVDFEEPGTEEGIEHDVEADDMEAPRGCHCRVRACRDCVEENRPHGEARVRDERADALEYSVCINTSLLQGSKY